MGALTHLTTARVHALEADTAVGRSSRSELRLEQHWVSAHHARIRWASNGWSIRDLASRNGTWVDGRRLGKGENCALDVGSRIAFGSNEEVWELGEGAAPTALVKLESTGCNFDLSSGPVALHVRGQISGSVTLEADDVALLETENDSLRLGNGQRFALEGEEYTVVIPQRIITTVHAERRVPMADAKVLFRAAPHEEHVAVELRIAEESYLQPQRQHNYLLLLLARERTRDQEAGGNPDHHGWMLREQLCSALNADRLQLNTDIYRLRKQFSELPLADPMRVVERRVDSHELRIGTGRLEIDA